VTVTTTTAVARRDKVKRAEQVAAVIRADIVANGWPVGRVLGAEPELMERYGVSRAVLREAVRIVEYLGVARMRQGPGGGLVVAAPNATAVTSAALVYFAYDRVKLEEVLGARRIIEEMAVELAATQATDAQLEHLRSWLAAANGRATERVEVWELHDVVAGLTGNPGIVLFVKIISRITALYGASGRRSAAKRRQERAATMTAHDRIVDAICARDATRARLAMRTHLEEIEGFLLSRRGRPPVTIGDPNRDFPGTKLGGQIAMHILTDIVDRGWPVGELLGSEAKLMAQHEASRAVIREAIRLLEFHQVVTTRRGPGGGVFVAAPSIDAVAEAMAVHLDFQGIDRQQLFEVRCALEVATVDVAATSFDAPRVEQLEAMLAAERAAQIEVVGQASHAWHGMIAELTGNRAVLLFILVLIRLTEERGGVPSEESAELVWRAHDTIMRAIAEHDGERARRRMARHLDAITPTLR
jgi:DNA-binding FadR family transcriptional regulator